MKQHARVNQKENYYSNLRSINSFNNINISLCYFSLAGRVGALFI